jgi:autotransporter-associated beta strand protein
MMERIHRIITELIRTAIIFTIIAWSGIPSSHAQSAFWSTGATGGGSWGVSSNWQGGTLPNGSLNAAGFALDFTPGASVTLDGDRTIGTIISTGSNPWNLDAGTGGILNVGSMNITGGPLTVTTPLSGVHFVKDGSGTLFITNASSTYSGTISIRAGTLSLIGVGNFSTSNNVLHLASGAILDTTQLTGGFRYGGDPTTRTAVNNGDLLDGTGTVKGGLKVKSGGTVFPGENGVGTLSIEGKALFEAGSNWKVKLGTANEGSANASNRLDVSGDLTLVSEMVMPIDGGGLTFQAGQNYDYVIGRSGTGTFDLGNVIFEPTGFPVSVTANEFSTITAGDSLLLRYSPVPEPAFALAIGFGITTGCRMLRAVWSRKHLPNA